MSKKNNVNPNFYKDGGRDHTEGPDKGDVQDVKREIGKPNRNAKKGPMAAQAPSSRKK